MTMQRKARASQAVLRGATKLSPSEPTGIASWDRGLWLSAVLLLAGCGTAPSAGYDSIELLDVSGTVTLDGQPLPNAVVTFEAEDGQFSYGLTDSSGHYRLQLDSEMDGVRPGTKTVRISTTRKILGLNSDEEGGDAPTDEANDEPAGERVPAKFNSESTLVADVSPSQTTFDFELQSN
jgi:hypothetical protein